MERFGMNKSLAIEWLIKSWHNLSAAKLLYEANHYTDIVAIEIHYSIEKSLKTFLAFENKKIPKTHDLVKISISIVDFIKFDNGELLDLKYISDYHIEESYPAFYRSMPPKEEIKNHLDFAFEIFEKVCDILDISLDEVQK
jgi:HEPN domain-containing protein